MWEIYFLVKYGLLFFESGVQMLLSTMMRSILLEIIIVFIMLHIFKKHTGDPKIGLLASNRTLDLGKA